MQNDILTSLTRLSDAELVMRVKSLVARERDATAQLVAHLAELDTRDVYLREGYGSLHAYCCDALGLSDGEAYNRIEVARAARRFPIILEMLAASTVTLTAVRLLAPRLTSANHREVLASARSRKKSEIEEIVARLSPRRDVRASGESFQPRPSRPSRRRSQRVHRARPRWIRRHRTLPRRRRALPPPPSLRPRHAPP